MARRWRWIGDRLKAAVPCSRYGLAVGARANGRASTIERNGPKHPVCEVDQLTARLICAFKVKLVEPIGDLRVRTAFGGHRARYSNARDAAACTTWKPSHTPDSELRKPFQAPESARARAPRARRAPRRAARSSGIKKTSRPPHAIFGRSSRDRMPRPRAKLPHMDLTSPQEVPVCGRMHVTTRNYT